MSGRFTHKPELGRIRTVEAPETFPRNYELLLEAGFSAPEVVEIMTANGAKVLGIDDDVGTVEAGKLADLVVIEGDLEVVQNLHGTKIVFRHGTGWDSAKLIDSIRGIVGIR